MRICRHRTPSQLQRRFQCPQVNRLALVALLAAGCGTGAPAPIGQTTSALDLVNGPCTTAIDCCNEVRGSWNGTQCTI
jgi:hypothetical protein